MGKRMRWLKLKQIAVRKLDFTQQLPGFERVELDSQVSAVFTELEGTAKSMRAHLAAHKSHLALLKKTQNASTVLATEMSRFFDQPEAQQKEADAFSTTMSFANSTHQFNKSSSVAFELYTETIIAPLQKWLDEFETVAPSVERLRQQQLVSRHYTSKVINLRVDGELRREDYKQTPKQDEQIARNELKQKQARVEYVTALADTVAQMKAQSESRFATMAQAATAHVKIQNMIRKYA